MSKEELEFEKVLAIAEILVNQANLSLKIAKIAFPKKRIFKKRNVKLVRKRRLYKNMALMNLHLSNYTAAVDVRTIMATPIPKYSKDRMVMREDGSTFIKDKKFYDSL